MRTTVSVGVVGLGYWGPNIARAFANLPGARLTWLCDRDRDALARAHARHPEARTATSLDVLLEDDELDAVVVATPPATHARLALDALAADKHVFVEKPLALAGADADRVVAEATERARCLVVGHVLLHHPAVRKLKELIETNQLGSIYYLYANRQNLGKVRTDENALWSLGPHDIAVLLHLLDDQPIEVSARGDCYLQRDVADVVFCHLRFATGISAHLHLSWLDPHKYRRLTVVGSKKMAEFDDMENERKLTIYEKTAVVQPSDNFGEYVQVQFGDIVSPRIANAEPLRLECEHFVDAIRSPVPAAGSSREAAAVVHVLEALQTSLDCDGAIVRVGGGVADGESTPLRLVHGL